MAMSSGKDKRKQKLADFMERAEKAAASGNLHAQRPDGSYINAGDTKFTSITFSSEDEMNSFIFSFLHHKGLNKPEISVVNPSPKEYRKDFMFPADMYLRKEAKEIMDASEHEIGRVIMGIFSDRKVPVINMIGGMDARDVKRVCVMFTKDSLLARDLYISFSGGVTDEEAYAFLED